MTGGVLATRYAKALLALAVEEKKHDAIKNELDSFSGAFEESGLEKLFLDPSLGLDEKLSLLNTLGKEFKLNKILLNFLKLLVEKKRIGELKLINHTFQSLLDEKVGRIRAEVVLPGKADAAQISAIKKGFEKSTGKEVIVDVKVDPSIIGGVIANVGSVVYDGSLKTQLNNIKKNIMRG